MSEQRVEYDADGLLCEGFLALPEGPGPFPGVAVFHNWYGQNDNCLLYTSPSPRD